MHVTINSFVYYYCAGLHIALYDILRKSALFVSTAICYAIAGPLCCQSCGYAYAMVWYVRTAVVLSVVLTVVCAACIKLVPAPSSENKGRTDPDGCSHWLNPNQARRKARYDPKQRPCEGVATQLPPPRY